MEGKQDVAVEGKRDMLLEVLADLYTIKAANKEENKVLERVLKLLSVNCASQFAGDLDGRNEF